MSSNWKVYCMNHDPGILVTEQNAAFLAEEAIAEGFEMHPHCDFVIIRVSGGPVEVGCTGKTGVCLHPNTEWIDTDWLRLLRYFEPDDPRVELKRIMNGHTLKHWTPARMQSLRYAF